MDVENQAVPLGKYRLDREGSYGWYPFISNGRVKYFKSVDDALLVKMKVFGCGNSNKFRIIDMDRCRRVKL